MDASCYLMLRAIRDAMLDAGIDARYDPDNDPTLLEMYWQDGDVPIIPGYGKDEHDFSGIRVPGRG